MTQDIARNGGDLRATLSLYGYCENDPINGIDPTGLWTKYIHYEKTKAWMRDEKAVGRKVSLTDADIVAEADNKVDKWYKTTNALTGWSWHFNYYPFYYPSSKKKGDSRMRHFWTKRDKAVSIWRGRKKNYRNKALKAFGEGLHPLQDKYAHLEWNPKHGIHKAYDPKGVDKKGNPLEVKNSFDNPDYDLTDRGKSKGKYRYFAHYKGKNKSVRHSNTKFHTEAQARDFLRLIDYKK